MKARLRAWSIKSGGPHTSSRIPEQTKENKGKSKKMMDSFLEEITMMIIF